MWEFLGTAVWGEGTYGAWQFWGLLSERASATYIVVKNETNLERCTCLGQESNRTVIKAVQWWAEW